MSYSAWKFALRMPHCTLPRLVSTLNFSIGLVVKLNFRRAARVLVGRDEAPAFPSGELETLLLLLPPGPQVPEAVDMLADIECEGEVHPAEATFATASAPELLPNEGSWRGRRESLLLVKEAGNLKPVLLLLWPLLVWLFTGVTTASCLSNDASPSRFNIVSPPLEPPPPPEETAAPIFRRRGFVVAVWWDPIQMWFSSASPLLLLLLLIVSEGCKFDAARSLIFIYKCLMSACVLHAERPLRKK
mmetsp:Transcript_65349/g.136894  ORF Transcript_65349/g.136894 Transcript_65349/m.136894 type:complete len:245 (+) Transcript_65349:1326-2060(+)